MSKIADKVDVQKLKAKIGMKLAEKGMSGRTAQVVFSIDISGSMDGLYRNETVQRVVERAMALSLNMDDDGNLPAFMFGIKAHAPVVATATNIDGFVKDQLLRQISGRLEGGTNYAPVLELVARHHFEAAFQQKKKGLFGGGGGVEVVKIPAVKDPVFNIFVTDGANGDPADAERIIREISKLPMFTQFVGIGRERKDFLEKLDDLSGRFVDNAGFCELGDISQMDDDDFVGALLNEYPEWCTKAQGLGLIL
ncbi:MAG: VWA domain-containing protein [Patescibacteria group bacterium]